jgi:hypothetical protein
LFIRIGAALLLPAITVACGGGPGSERLRDGVGMSLPVAAADGGEVSLPPASPPDNCANPEQGCPCTDLGATIACKGPVVRDGNYTTCAGTRECVQGSWGPCWPPNYSAPTVTTAHSR